MQNFGEELQRAMHQMALGARLEITVIRGAIHMQTFYGDGRRPREYEPEEIQQAVDSLIEDEASYLRKPK